MISRHKQSKPVQGSPNLGAKNSQVNLGSLLEVYIFMSKATIKFIGGSYLKRLPQQSSKLIGDQKVPVIAGQEFGIKWSKKEGDHVLFELESPIAGVFNWYAYASHIQVNGQSLGPSSTIITPSTTTDSTQLSQNFKLWEFVVSQTASRHGINNTPQQVHIAHLRTLCQQILEPARKALGPLRINSGYRSPELNRIIGGSRTSAHMQGYAADVNPLQASKMEFAKWVKNNCKFDQIILEFGTPTDPAWIHVSCDPRGNRDVIKTVPGGGYAVARL